ncbi:MAG: hypothetical protein UT02_C0014G0015 [Parcubacteria group bacterium GW2011_GWC2_38_7]|nr:MAG: hypothetical protein UT02_C0014G0015 [Parcubacteria group bacterium GW2011_GWC2_38_7]
MYEESFDPSALDLGSAVNVTYSGATTTGDVGGLIAFMGVMWLFILVLYVYQAICMMYIAKRTGTANGWFAFIPILSTILMLQIAKRPLWWIILMLIPFVNIVISILVLIDVMKVLKRPTWWVIMQFIPFVNLVFLGLMAWGKNGTSTSPKATVIPPTAPAV